VEFKVSFSCKFKNRPKLLIIALETILESQGLRSHSSNSLLVFFWAMYGLQAIQREILEINSQFQSG
jgi:hypothetical protein